MSEPPGHDEPLQGTFQATPCDPDLMAGRAGHGTEGLTSSTPSWCTPHMQGGSTTAHQLSSGPSKALHAQQHLGPHSKAVCHLAHIISSSTLHSPGPFIQGRGRAYFISKVSEVQV